MAAASNKGSNFPMGSFARLHGMRRFFISLFLFGNSQLSMEGGPSAAREPELQATTRITGDL